MFYTVLSATGALFWLLVFVIAVLNARFLATDNASAAIAITVIVIIATFLFTDASLPLFWVAILVPTYFVVGIAWAVYKWDRFLDEKIKAQIEGYAKYVADVKAKDPTALARPFESWTDKITASDESERIIGWIVLWPWSMLYVVLKFPWRLATKLWEYLSSTFQRIVDRKYASRGR
jgi:hypothetical protein